MATTRYLIECSTEANAATLAAGAGWSSGGGVDVLRSVVVGTRVTLYADDALMATRIPSSATGYQLLEMAPDGAA